MRLLPLAAALSALFAGAAWAQTADLDRLRLQSMQQQNMQAQEQQNVLRRADANIAQALSDQNRTATEQNLRASRPVTTTIAPSSGAQTGDGGDASALRRLQDAELEASNARLRAIKPASQ